MLELLTIAWLHAQAPAGCFTRKPNGNIVLHECKPKSERAQPKAGQRLPQLPPMIDRHPRIFLVPVGPEWSI